MDTFPMVLMRVPECNFGVTLNINHNGTDTESFSFDLNLSFLFFPSIEELFRKRSLSVLQGTSVRFSTFGFLWQFNATIVTINRYQSFSWVDLSLGYQEFSFYWNGGTIHLKFTIFPIFPHTLAKHMKVGEMPISKKFGITL